MNAEQDLMASGAYYYQEDDKSLASNQFVYVTNYSAEAGFDSDQYEFTFEDFGYYQEDGTEDEAESTDDEVSAYSASEDSGIESDFHLFRNLEVYCGYGSGKGYFL